MTTTKKPVTKTEVKEEKVAPTTEAPKVSAPTTVDAPIKGDKVLPFHRGNYAF